MKNLEYNYAIVRRFIEQAFEKFDRNAMDELLTDNFHAHPWAPLGFPDGPEGMKQVLSVFEAAFSKAHVTVEDMISGKDKVAVRYTFEADHTGDILGVTATGKRISIPGIFVARMEQGKLAEYWRHEDLQGLMQQKETIAA